mmetsp:Transcript_49142/g.117060  ORF Transcript_49142/g.117060 Transcript_49142/m.117060 type:complete len:260 (-) Transcript_49142:143-922(-)
MPITLLLELTLNHLSRARMNVNAVHFVLSDASSGNAQSLHCLVSTIHKLLQLACNGDSDELAWGLCILLEPFHDLLGIEGGSLFHLPAIHFHACEVTISVLVVLPASRVVTQSLVSILDLDEDSCILFLLLIALAVCLVRVIDQGQLLVRFLHLFQRGKLINAKYLVVVDVLVVVKSFCCTEITILRLEARICLFASGVASHRSLPSVFIQSLYGLHEGTALKFCALLIVQFVGFSVTKTLEGVLSKTERPIEGCHRHP